MSRSLWIDVTRSLDDRLAIYPGDPAPRIESSTDAQGVTVTRFAITTHTGTHLDLPGHLRPSAASPPAQAIFGALVGSARVIAVARKGGRTISLDEILSAVGRRPPRRLLLRTGASGRRWRGLSPEAAAWLAGRAILVGTDALSIDPPGAELPAHRALLSRGTLILENLRLERAAPGSYHLIALPLRLPVSDGAPVRAVLRGRGDGA